MEKVRILPIYPQYRINGVMRFIRDLYEDREFWKKEGFEIINPLGIWFDLKIKISDQLEYPSTEEAKTQKEKEIVKELFKEYINYHKPNIIHLNVYVIDYELLKFLRKYKETHNVKIVYTIHSLAYQDFERSPEDRRYFNGLSKTFLDKLISFSKKFFKIEEESKKVEMLKRIAEEEKIDLDESKLLRLLIRTYMLAQQYFILKELADEIICISNFIYKSLEEKYLEIFEQNRERIKVIHNGTDFFKIYGENLEKIEESRRNWRLKYHKPGDFIIMYVGRITPAKGIDELVDAFLELIKDSRYKDRVFLYLSGPGARDYILKIIEDNRLNSQQIDNIRYIDENTLPKPFTSDEKIRMATIYRTANIIVYPSNYEPFGLVPIEATSCGTPVIVRNIDNLKTFGEEGITYTFENKEELLKMLKKVIEDYDLIIRDIEKRRKIIREKYNLENMKREYLMTFKLLIFS